jgi:type II pantothenate kinase
MRAAFDLGLTNTKIAYETDDSVVAETTTVPSRAFRGADTVRELLRADGRHAAEFDAIVVTGGQSARLPDDVNGVSLLRVNEVRAVGLGGLRLLREQGNPVAEALVVSCGSGSAFVAARGQVVAHSTGSAFGGGTLSGLGRLLIGEQDPRAIDALALEGDTSRVDLELLEATGGHIGALPPDATAVNFGRIARLSATDAPPARADIAAALVTLVAQAIGMIALNAARAEALETIALVGFLPSLPSMAAQLQRCAGFFGRRFEIPDRGGYATVLGALDADADTRHGNVAVAS